MIGPGSGPIKIKVAGLWITQLLHICMYFSEYHKLERRKVDIYFHFSWPLLGDVIWVIISTVTPCHFSSLPSTPIHFLSNSRWGGCLHPRFKSTIMIIPQFGAVFTIAQKPWNMKQRILFSIFLDGRTLLSLKESKSCGGKKAIFDQNSVFAQINDIF